MAYPSTIDSLTTPSEASFLSGAGTPAIVHSTLHGQINQSITAIENIIGTSPTAGFATIDARISSLATITGTLNSKDTALASGTGALQTQVGSIWNSKVPYSGASAHVNLTQYSLTASSISSGGGITGSTISGITLLAGNFQAVTASQDIRLTGLESATSNLNSKDSALASGTGTLQTQVGSLWNAKVPYAGASANVNLLAYGLTASSISSGGGVTGTTVSAIILLAGNFQTVTASQDSRLSGLESATANLNSKDNALGSGTGALQTQVGSLWNTKVPYTGTTANLNLASYSLTATSVSSLSITSASISSLTLSAGNLLVTSLSALGGISGANVKFLSLISLASISALTISGGIGSLFTSLSSDGTLSAGSFYTRNTISAGTICASSVHATGITAASVSSLSITSAGSISGLTVSAGMIRMSTLVFGDGTTQTTAGEGIVTQYDAVMLASSSGSVVVTVPGYTPVTYRAGANWGINSSSPLGSLYISATAAGLVTVGSNVEEVEDHNIILTVQKK